MHGQSHTFHRLAVPLPGGQHVHYQEFQEVQDADQVQCCDPHLTAWFKLNQLDATAIEYLYCEIPSPLFI